MEEKIMERKQKHDFGEVGVGQLVLAMPRYLVRVLPQRWSSDKT